MTARPRVGPPRAQRAVSRIAGTRPGAGGFALALVLALAAALFAPPSRSQPEPPPAARPASEEFQTLVLQASRQVDAIRQASRSYYLDFQAWPGDIVDLIAEGYLPESFPPLTPWGEPFQFSLAGDQLNIDVVVPTNEELSDLAERTETLDPTTEAEKTVTEDEPEYADDYFTQAATSVQIKTEVTERQPYDKRANREFERIARTLTVTRDRQYLDNVKLDIDTGEPPVGYVTLDAGTEAEARIATDRQRLSINRGGRFVGGLVVDVVRDSDAPDEWYADLSGASRLNELAVSLVEDREDPQYRLQLSGESRINSLQANRIEADSAEIESAEIIVLNGSAPINRGQLDTFTVTQLTAGENIIVDNPVGTVTVSIVDSPVFENVATRGLATLNTLAVGEDATIQGNLLVGRDIDVSRDLFVGGRVVIGEDSEVVEDFSLYVEGDIGVEEDIFTDGSIRAGGLSVNTNSIAHDAEPLVLRPNAIASPSGGLELRSDGIDLSLLALGNNNLRIESEGASMVFRNGRNAENGFSFRDQDDQPIVVVDTVNTRVGIGLGDQLPQTTLHVGGVILADAFVGDGSGLYDVTAGALAGEGDLVIEAGAAGGGDASIVFRAAEETVARFSAEGNLGIGGFAAQGDIPATLSVGDDEEATFTVDGITGDIRSEGSITVTGDATLGDDVDDDALMVAGRSTFASDVSIAGALTVANENFTGDMVSFRGGGNVMDAGSVLAVVANPGFPAGNAVVAVERPGAGSVVEFDVSSEVSPDLRFGFYALDSRMSFMRAPPGSLAVGVGAGDVAGRLFVMNEHELEADGEWQEIAIAAAEDPNAVFVLDGGNDLTGDDGILNIGTTTDAHLQLITNGLPALEVDDEQNVAVLEDNQLRFRGEDAYIFSPGEGELRAHADGQLALTSPSEIVVRTNAFSVVSDRIDIEGGLVVSGTLTVMGSASFAGDVTLGDSTSDTITIAGSLQGLAFEGEQGGRVTLTGGDASGQDVTVALPSSSGILVVMEEPDLSVRLLGDLAVGGGVVVSGDSTFTGRVLVEGGLVAGGAAFLSNLAPLSVEIVAPEGPAIDIVTDAGAGDIVSLYVFSGETAPLADRAALGSLALSADGFLWLRTTVSGRPTWRQILADGLVFQSGGNQFGEPAVLGTNDAHPLRLVAGGSVAVSVGSTQVEFLKPLVASGGFVVSSTASFGELQVDGAANLNGDVYLGDSPDDTIRFGGVIVGREDGLALAFRPLSGAGRLSLAVPVLERDATVRLPADGGELLTNAQVRIITTEMLAAGAVTLGDIADGAIDGAALADNAVTAAKIADGAVTAEKIADGAVTAAKLASGAALSITSADIADGAITAEKIADGAITSEKIADGAITAAKFAEALALSGDDIAQGAIESDHIANNAVTTDKIADDAIVSRHILDGAVTADDLAPSSVGAAQLAADAVGERQLAAGAVGIRHLSAGAVDGVSRAVLSPGAVGAEQLAAGAVTAAKLAAGAVGAEQLAAGAVGNLQLVAGERYDRITRVGRLEGLEVAGQIRAELPLASAAGSALCLSGAAISQCSSLAALKTAVRPLDIGLKEVLSLRARRFSWLGDGREDFGFVAEEVVAVSPLLGAYDADGRLVGVRYRQMSALLARALQQQHAALAPLAEALSAAAGRVGVGKDPHPDYRLDVAGAARAGLFVELSDRRLKRDVRALTGAEALSALSGVSGVRYRWSAGHRRARPDAGPGWQVGVIAQDVERALPELVRRGSDGYLSVSYDRFAPYLIEAVNALAGRVESLSGALSPDGDLRARSLALERDLAVGERFALRRSSTLASLLRVDSERRADDEVEGYLSARDVYLADRGQWGSELGARVAMSDETPSVAECVDAEHSGAMKFVASRGELYVCSGEEGWLSTPLASSDG